MNRIIRAAEALGVRPPKNVREKLAKLAALLVALTGLTMNAGIAQASTLSQSKVALSDPRPSVSSSYTFTGGETGGLVSVTAIKCVQVTVSTAVGGTAAPAGFNGGSAAVDTAASTLVSNHTGWTLAVTTGAGSTGTNNVFKYTTSGSAVAPTGTTAQTFKLDTITNSSSVDTKFWFTLKTFTDTACTDPGALVDRADPQFINTAGSTLSLTVDNTLTFTVAGHATGACGAGGPTATVDNTASPNTIPYGTVTANAIACQVLTAATNATNGYTIYIRDNGQLQNALGQKIPDVASTGGSYTNGSTNAAPGSFTNNTSSLATYPGFNQGAYGYTTSDASLSTGAGAADRFTNGGPKWASYGHSADGSANAEIGYEPVGVTSTPYYIAHQVGITTLTQPGTYSTTVIYTCTPIY